MPTENLNDSLADLLDGPVATEPRGPVNAPADYKPNFEQKCAKCGGTGQFSGWSGHSFGACFACKGAGKRTFKTSPEARAKSRAYAADRAARKADEDRAESDKLVAVFQKANPAEYAWLTSKVGTGFAFADSVHAALRKYGDLTDGQLNAIRRIVEKDAARAAEQAARIANAPQVDAAGIDRLKASFDAAIAFTRAKADKKGIALSLRGPRITVGGITISPAKADSANAGALYVKAHGDYMGKIQDGKFHGRRECDEATTAKVLAFITDPQAAAKAYGQETGVCCVCNATLKSAWRLRGIGPVCAEKMGWDGVDGTDDEEES